MEPLLQIVSPPEIVATGQFAAGANTCCDKVHVLSAEKVAVSVCVLPSQVRLLRVYAWGLLNGALNVWETLGTEVTSVIVSVPVVGAFTNSIFPEILKVFDDEHAVGVAVTANIPQFNTILQLVAPVPPVCEKVIKPDSGG